MYRPNSFDVQDLPTLHKLMAQYDFATLVTNQGGSMVASHLPILLDTTLGSFGTLFGHVALANDQWKAAGTEALVIFSGPHAYVSPTWYDAAGTVPTWNYASVHAYGQLETVEEPREVLTILDRLTRAQESRKEPSWVFDPEEEHVARMLRAIVGFKIEITRLEGKWKLSQNQSLERRKRVQAALQNEPRDQSQAVARLMAETLIPPGSH